MDTPVGKSARRGPKWTLQARLVVAAIGIVFGLLAGEGLARLLYPSAKSIYRPSSRPGLFWEHKPNLHQRDQFATTVVAHDPKLMTTTHEYVAGEHATNSLGLLERELGADALEGRDVVLCFGDSTTAGSFVLTEQAYPRQLEGLLGRRSKRALVINAGVGGYNLEQYRAHLELLGPVFKPKTVVVGLYMNDHVPWDRFEGFYTRLTHYSALFRALQPFRGKLRRPSVPDPLTSDFIKELNLDFGWRSARALLQYTTGHGDLSSVLHSAKTTNDLGTWNRSLPILAEMDQTASRMGARLVVVVLPVQFQLVFGYDNPEPQKTILSFLQTAGIPAVDMTEIFRDAIRRGRPLYFSVMDPAHFNSEGHRLIAEALAKELAIR